MITDPDILAAYNQDAIGFQGNFQGLFRPRDEEDVAEIIRECRAKKIAVTPQGCRTSLTGAAICKYGVALSLEKMNRILDIDTKNRFASIQPGVVLADLHAEVEKQGLFYPVNPTSASECTIGGNVATNASGSRTLKYGATLHWVRQLRIVDGTGTCFDTGTRTSEKNAAGYAGFYNPAAMFVGSEGTLGIVTRIIISLTRPPEGYFIILAFFDTIKKALDFVIASRDMPLYDPRSIEFMDRACLDIIKEKSAGITIPEEAEAMVYVEQEYQTFKEKEERLESWFRLIEKGTPLSQDSRIADDERRKGEIADLRHMVPEKMNELGLAAVKNGGGKISTDWAVPYRKIPDLFEYYDSIRSELGDMVVTRFAHIGEGHPHFNFIASNPQEKRIAEAVDTKIARKAVQLGGTIVGEHGIGKAKRNHLPLQYPGHQIRLMKTIKTFYDPDSILAPGNIFPEEQSLTTSRKNPISSCRLHNRVQSRG